MAAIAALVLIIGIVSGVCLDLIYGLSEFKFETVGDVRPRFFMVVINDLVEILLNERMEGEPSIDHSLPFANTTPKLFLTERLYLA